MAVVNETGKSVEVPGGQEFTVSVEDKDTPPVLPVELSGDEAALLLATNEEPSDVEGEIIEEAEDEDLKEPGTNDTDGADVMETPANVPGNQEVTPTIDGKDVQSVVLVEPGDEDTPVAATNAESSTKNPQVALRESWLPVVDWTSWLVEF